MSTNSTDSQNHGKKNEGGTDDAKPGFFSFENLRSLALLFIVIIAFRGTVASPYHVPTASMEPTIKVGDRLLAYKLAYSLKLPLLDTAIATWGTPKRGDIIVFRYPRDPDIDYVKRVVGIAGDEIEIIDDILYINGEPQPRTDHNDDRTILDDIDDQKEVKLLYRENLAGVDHWVMQNIQSSRHFTKSNWPPPGSGPYKVPEDSVFCIGDNRDNSTDSRVWHQVPLDYVRGKALFVIWSLYTPRDSNWPVFRWNRFGAKLQ
jgi:signal peptidase I